MTVESDPERAEIARARLDGLANVELLVGDWRELLPQHAPFDFLFFDAGHIDDAPEVVDLLAPDGLLLKDDLTLDRPGPDPVRAFLLDHPELVAVEILTTASTAAILAAKRSADTRAGQTRRV